MATCTAGHQSVATDYCDVCGLTLAPAPAPAPAEVTAALPATPAASTTTCANCGAARDGRFCEECGHDATAPTPASRAPAPATLVWTAVVQADRGWFDEVRRRDGPDAADLEFPRYYPELRFELTGRQMTIGRRSRSRGTDPDIDLSGPQLDPGASAQHGLLLAGPDGWQIVDLGSTNGTSVNDAPSTIPTHTPVLLSDGDRIHLGAWTTITVTRAH